MTGLTAHLVAVRQTLRERLLTPRRRFSQHFLLQESLLRRIVAAAGDVAGREVVEIGPGPGGLTAALLDAGARVTALELDRDWADYVRAAFAGRAIDVLQEDALATAPRRIAELAARSGRPPLVVGNLPYSIASPLVVDLVHADPPPERLVVMVQAEVAQRLVAPPGEGARGLLTLLVGLHADARRLFKVPPGSFVPPPKVQSAVVELVPDPARAAAARARPGLDLLLRAAFQARRKMLRRALAERVSPSALARVPAALLERRAEELTEADWFVLADAVAASGGACSGE